jgi:hypothetical protein
LAEIKDRTAIGDDAAHMIATGAKARDCGFIIRFIQFVEQFVESNIATEIC